MPMVMALNLDLLFQPQAIFLLLATYRLIEKWNTVHNLESLTILDFAREMFLLYEICFAGVNTPDHDVLFDNIVSRVTREVSPYVTQIKHKSTSTSSLKHIMQSLASQLNDIGSESGRRNIPVLSNTMCTFSHIEKWYEAMETKPLSPKVSFM